MPKIRHECGQKLSFPRGMEGKTGRCPKCHKSVVVPFDAEDSRAPEPKKSKGSKTGKTKSGSRIGDVDVAGRDSRTRPRSADPPEGDHEEGEREEADATGAPPDAGGGLLVPESSDDLDPDSSGTGEIPADEDPATGVEPPAPPVEAPRPGAADPAPARHGTREMRLADDSGDDVTTAPPAPAGSPPAPTSSGRVPPPSTAGASARPGTPDLGSFRPGAVDPTAARSGTAARPATREMRLADDSTELPALGAPRHPGAGQAPAPGVAGTPGLAPAAGLAPSPPTSQPLGPTPQTQGLGRGLAPPRPPTRGGLAPRPRENFERIELDPPPHWEKYQAFLDGKGPNPKPVVIPAQLMLKDEAEAKWDAASKKGPPSKYFCPGCKSRLDLGAMVCLKCGLDLRSGRSLDGKTKLNESGRGYLEKIPWLKDAPEEMSPDSKDDDDDKKPLLKRKRRRI